MKLVSATINFGFSERERNPLVLPTSAGTLAQETI